MSKFTGRMRVNAKHNPVQLLHAQADEPLLPLALEFSASAPAAWHGGHLFSIYIFLWINMRVISNSFFFRKHADTCFCAC
jgi:hypothetical protein